MTRTLSLDRRRAPRGRAHGRRPACRPGRGTRRRQGRQHQGRQRQEAHPGAAPVAGGADRPLSRRSAHPDASSPSTYPLEIVQLHQYLAKNPELKDKALADSVAKQPWDPSIQSMAALPGRGQAPGRRHPVDHRAGQRIPRQQKDVMDAVQVMRKKAKDKGALESNEQQKVETKVVEKKEVIVVRVGEPRGRLRAVVQPDGGVRRADLPRTRRSTIRLLPAGRGVRVVLRRDDVGGGHVGWGLLPVWLGGRRQRLHQPQQQLQQHQRQQPNNINSGTGAATTGSTTRRIAAARRTATGPPQTSTAARCRTGAGEPRRRGRERSERVGRTARVPAPG